MPELPEVEVIARGLDKGLAGRTVVGLESGVMTRLSDSPRDLERAVRGAVIRRVWRRAKVLVMDFSTGVRLAFHLKMTGRVVHGQPRPLTGHDRVQFLLDDGTAVMFSDMRKFGYVRAFVPDQWEAWEFLKRLGPEPLETPAAELARQVAGRRAGIKGLLLNQTVVAGIGNIYADESLFRASLHPCRRADTIELESLVLLFEEVQEVLRQAIRENGSSIRDYVNAAGDAGAFQNNFNVYGRCGEGCRKCGSKLEKRTVAGRTSTFCPCCQPK